MLDDSELRDTDAAQIFNKMKEIMLDYSQEEEYRAKLFKKCHTKLLDPALVPDTIRDRLISWNDPYTLLYPGMVGYANSGGKTAYKLLREAMQYSGLRLSVDAKDAVK